MDYIKKFIILKETTRGFSVNGQPLSGIVRAEHSSGETEINLSLINFAAVSEGSFYAVFFFSDGKRFLLPLGSTPFSLSDRFSAGIRGGFACLIAYVGDQTVPVAFGTARELDFSTNDLLEYLDENLEKPTAAEIPPAEEEKTAAAYDDLAVATENYYLNETEGPAFEGEKYDEQPVFSEPPVDADAAGEEKDERKEEAAPLRDDEAHFAFGQSCESGYYLKVKDELDKIFAENPEEDCLKSTLPDSRWVKIHYSNGYYLVGLVEEKGKPKYICYGVPAKYEPYPPKELAGYCTFIPLSIFEMKGDGFWMLFQSAETGECIHFDEK